MGVIYGPNNICCLNFKKRLIKLCEQIDKGILSNDTFNFFKDELRLIADNAHLTININGMGDNMVNFLIENGFELPFTGNVNHPIDTIYIDLSTFRGEIRNSKQSDIHLTNGQHLMRLIQNSNTRCNNGINN